MLRRVAAGALPESLRLYAPENVMLFSSLDARRPGYEEAVERARSAGFSAALRLAGGHAAAFLEESMAFAWAIPGADARAGIRGRFERLANLVVEALRSLGLDARVGEIPGEYCPGEYSVNLGGRVKIMGVGQRVIRGGAHVGGVLTIGQSAKLRESLIPVYDALGLEFRPETAGGVQDFDPSIGVADVISAHQEILKSWGHVFVPARFDAGTRGVADTLAPTHEPLRGGSAGSRPSQGTAAPIRDSGEPDETAPFQVLGGKTLLQADRAASADRRAASTDDGEG